jgi:hypothetical protein
MDSRPYTLHSKRPPWSTGSVFITLNYLILNYQHADMHRLIKEKNWGPSCSVLRFFVFEPCNTRVFLLFHSKLFSNAKMYLVVNNYNTRACIASQKTPDCSEGWGSGLEAVLSPLELRPCGLLQAPHRELYLIKTFLGIIREILHSRSWK